MSRPSSKWVALCTAAIGITYAAGYVVTDQQNSLASNASVTGTHAQESLAKKHQNTQKDGQADHRSNSANTKYKDGTYSGEGMNRIGSVAVSVTIKNGKITRVQITDCTTSYPKSKIEQLPAQVIARQSSNVDHVSGATESTNDFIAAVTNALSQAQS
ncbi:FMN-binding protein [Sporolactobacillus sp. CPB3-1]|uniref:FMN-binding protein n=1 Tax=Sporolactobacillus mangiferae TaxID=2940498 RepID=A0ABT0M7K4_9BACL|nr:FMN-binding protein [Sporolactobacillus mangiferae]MCL1630370.1 FMN-binding protein [Sporolactobacillus mangiferae]